MRNAYIAVVTALGILLAGCDVTGTSGFEEQYVVQGFLEAGAPVGQYPVRVSRTAPIDTTYSFSELAVRNAEVHIEQLDEAGAVQERYRLRERQFQHGVYETEDSSRVQPLATYRLRVQLPEGAGETELTTTTLVPDTFRLVSASADTVLYQGDEQLRLTVTQSRYPDRQSVYVFSTEARGRLTRDRLTPLLEQFLEEDVNLENIRQNTSPIINETNYEVSGGGRITIPVPWLAIAFYGPNTLGARALDDNLYDYFRSHEAQQGGSTLAPGELPNVIDHVEGGTGVFGSFARVSYAVFVRRPPDG